jgi:hypothetical protein
MGDGAVCATVRGRSGTPSGDHACMLGCEVGADDPEAILGPEGHGKGCRVGYSCRYNGSDSGAAGICVGGAYNEVTEPNIGAPCQGLDECYSPFGYGSCVTLRTADVTAPTAVCTVIDCAAPGLPADVCGSGAACVGFTADVSYCAKLCSDATECPTGFACVDDDASPGTPRICFPACTEDTECRKGEERCQIAAGASSGSCVASGP